MTRFYKKNPEHLRVRQDMSQPHRIKGRLMASINSINVNYKCWFENSVELQKKTLIIRLTSSVLREELSYGKEKIIKMINEEIGDKVISKLMLV